MKKFITVLAALCVCVLSAGMLFGCGGNAYTFIAPDGSPIAALADMWGEDAGNSQFTYKVTSEANINGEFTSGADFVVAPLNIGAGFHNKAQTDASVSDYKLVNVISWGVLYFVSNEGYKPRADFADAKAFLSQFDGKSVTTIGRAAIPGKSVEYVFGQAETAVTLNASDASTIQTALLKGDPMTAVFAEPAITATKTKKAEFDILGSVSDVYTELTGEDFPMAGLFVKAAVYADDKRAVEAVDARVKTSVAKYNEDPEAAGTKAESIEGCTLKAAVLKNAAPKMNMTYKSATDAKSAVKAMLTNIGIKAEDDLFV